jgi:hypothetical protein
MKYCPATIPLVYGVLSLALTTLYSAETNAVRFLNSNVSLGNVAADQSISLTFVLTNGSDQSVKIANTDVSCRCVSVVNAPSEIAAHAVGDFELSLSTARSSGAIMRALTVELEGGQILTGEIEALVTDATTAPPKEGDYVPAPGPRERAYGISGPGAKHKAAWSNYNARCNSSVVELLRRTVRIPRAGNRGASRRSRRKNSASQLIPAPYHEQNKIHIVGNRTRLRSFVPGG